MNPFIEEEGDAEIESVKENVDIQTAIGKGRILNQ